MNDLELMYLLEEEGYEPSFENLAILKEGIENGEFKILDEASTAKKRAAKGGIYALNYLAGRVTAAERKNPDKNHLNKVIEKENKSVADVQEKKKIAHTPDDKRSQKILRWGKHHSSEWDNI